jgi:hypothetical protein
MKKIMAILISVLIAFPAVFAASAGFQIGIDITPEEFPPHIWLCDSRIVMDDCVESGRVSDCSMELVERMQNYAFEGEQITWNVLVMDKNKIEEVRDVVATLGRAQGTGNSVEVECGRTSAPSTIPAACNARILEQDLTGTDFKPDTQAFYQCILTVESSNSMYGDFFITVEVMADDGEATIDENEFWFLNPTVALTVEGSLVFDEVRPGTLAYSDSVKVGNDADLGSGVLLDMFISGTDFYDPSSSGAKCPVSNRLKLSDSRRSRAGLGSGTASNTWHMSPNGKCQAGSSGLKMDNADHLCYYAAGGGYTSAAAPNADSEGYRPLVYSDSFSGDFYNDAEIIFNGNFPGGYSFGNVLAPGSELAITFKLGLPEPCFGDFSDGRIFFWGEAI